MTRLEEIDKTLIDSEFYELCNMMGKKRVLLILLSIHANIHTFSGIMKAIPKINTGILTKRLGELVDKEYIVKSSKSEYHLSKRWKEIIEWLESLRERAIETGRDKQIQKNKNHN